MKLLVVFGLFFLFACNSNSNLNKKEEIDLDYVKSSKKIQTILSRYEEKSQFFSVQISKPSEIVGKNGTVIKINPNDLVCEDGSKLGNNIQVELKELMNQKQLLFSSAQTISDGKLLESGGAYFINLTSDNKQLKLKESKTLAVNFPIINSKKMELFYGEKDSLNNMNWNKTGENFTKNSKDIVSNKKQVVDKLESDQTNNQNDIDAMFDYVDNQKFEDLTVEEQKEITQKNKNDELTDKTYKSIELKKFGWINCDYFLDSDNKGLISLNFKPKKNNEFLNVYILFSDINCVLTDYHCIQKNKNSMYKNDKIPFGKTFTVIVLGYVENKLLAFKKKLKFDKNITVNVDLNEINESKLQDLFNQD
ncbi:MAG: hypothetical protein ACK479_14770 [Fluviicola sp.]